MLRTPRRGMIGYLGGGTGRDEEGVRGDSPASGEDAKPDGTDPGRFCQGRSELQTGLVEHAHTRRTPDTPDSCFEQPYFQEGQAMLADDALPGGEEGGMSSLAI